MKAQVERVEFREGEGGTWVPVKYAAGCLPVSGAPVRSIVEAVRWFEARGWYARHSRRGGRVYTFLPTGRGKRLTVEVVPAVERGLE